jgi:D-sedoheptulose 7-phosphate isomerase
MTVPSISSAEAARQLRELAELAASVAESHADEVAEIAAEVARVLVDGGKVLFCGNGGSAADAQHLAAEYVVRFRETRPALAAIALTTDTSVLTAAGNDLGFDRIFARQVEALGRPGDLLILHTTSGESENLLAAARAARAMGLGTIALSAKGGGRLSMEVDRCLVLPTDVTARAQEVQLAVGHLVCDMVERALARSSNDGPGGEAPGG